MARKTLADLDPGLTSAVEEFQAVSLVKYEMAKDAYDLQDKTTKKVIDRIMATLQVYATGYITVAVGGSVYPVKLDNQYLGYNLLWLAMEIVKDLALCGVRVAAFEFPPSIRDDVSDDSAGEPMFCSDCG
jgi:hypothetical protein